MLSWCRLLICILIIIRLKTENRSRWLSEVMFLLRKYIVLIRKVWLRMKPNILSELRQTCGLNISGLSVMWNIWYYRVWMLCPRCNGYSLTGKIMRIFWSESPRCLIFMIFTIIITPDICLILVVILCLIQKKEHWMWLWVPLERQIFIILWMEQNRQFILRNIQHL